MHMSMYSTMVAMETVVCYHQVRYRMYCPRGRIEGHTARSKTGYVLYLPRDSSPSAINAVVHESCGTLAPCAIET